MRIYTDENGITIELHGKEQFFALRACVKVPFDTIESVVHEEKFQDWRKWEVRLPGTGALGKLIAGSFWTEAGWDFLYVRNPRGIFRPVAENVLVITTSQDRYRRVIVTCEPKQGQEIAHWWQDKHKDLN
jgi:hypothetical protein